MYCSRLLETRQRIEIIIKERQETGLLRSDLEAGFDETAYQEALALLNQELSEIPSGKALRVAEDSSIQPSLVCKRIGQTADILLLLLPNDGIAKGIKVASDATLIHAVLLFLIYRPL